MAIAKVQEPARTFRVTRRCFHMTSSAATAKSAVEIGKKHILDQKLRIERQRELIAKLEGDGHSDIIVDACRLLAEMEQALAGMKAHYAAAQERLAQEQSLSQALLSRTLRK